MADATFDAIKIGIASPEMIRQWSYGEVMTGLGTPVSTCHV